MATGKWIFAVAVLFLTSGCEEAKDFHYFLRNDTRNELTVFVDYSISARGNQQYDTLTIAPHHKKLVYTHSGLGGFYTGAIEEIRFSGADTLRQKWKNRDQAEISKHFFRRKSWKLTHQGDNEERYQFVVKPRDLKVED